ncbi:MAG TPA: ABC transporter substrate-binding protein [Acidimicrobiia bacterium]
MLFAIALLASACSGTSSSSTSSSSTELRGARLRVLAVWTGAEARRFAAVIRAFEAHTGVVIDYVSTGNRIADELAARRAAHDLPDVAFVPQPGLLRQYARAGLLVPLGAGTVNEVTRSYPPVWRELGSVDGRLYGVWFKAANKSLIWYDVGAFERAGVIPPSSLEGLVAVARKLATTRVPVFSLGARDGWTLTDWFENVYLALAGPGRYDELAAHHMAWTDPSVKRALRLLSRLWSPSNVAGGAGRALTTTFEQSVRNAFSSPPDAAMVMEGDFVAGAITGTTKARLGIDADVFPFPQARVGDRFVVGGGDAAVVMRRSAAADAFVRYLATPQAAVVWARYGGFISANVNVDLSAYPDAVTRGIARALIEAGDGFRFDLSDLQPAQFGGIEGRGMRRRLQDFLVTDDVDGTAAGLEADATAAYG